MRALQSGFTLIEWLIVISILSLLVACLAPPVADWPRASFALADSANLRWHSQQLELYRMQHKGELPDVGGHEFVLSTWKLADKTPENFDRYFTPGRRDNDPDYRRLRAKVEHGEEIWADVKGTTSRDTHYAGRAKEHVRTATSGEDEALMANDNEGVWSHADGTVNVLFYGGTVRTYGFLDLKARGYAQGELDANKPLETTGPNSSIPECRKLAR